jgi:hypothetical protein
MHLLVYRVARPGWIALTFPSGWNVSFPADYSIERLELPERVHALK